MNATDLYIAIAIGITISLLVESFVGVSAGGMIVPAYLSLSIEEPLVILEVLFISILTYIIVNFIFAKFIILYGKRYFVLNILVALCLKLIIELVLFPALLPIDVVYFRGVGAIVPGLLANTYRKQSIPITVVTCAIVTVVIALINYLFAII
ncbi:MAG: poly-gamma-glutamate biosynthesis protein PgsC [Tissierellia bacterium]|nr:poly-gamma-glutamate biosynthesis protein PgsC [Tissierellia bacterium]